MRNARSTNARCSNRCARDETANCRRGRRIDWILFRAQLEGINFGNRVLKFERTNPQVYVGDSATDFFVAEEGLRHAAEPRRRSDGAIEQMPVDAQAGPEQSAKPCKTLRAARHSVGALDRFTAE